MYFPDLSPYLPHLGNVFNVGWLEKPHSFTTGVVLAEIVAKLIQAMVEKRYVQVTWGTYCCSFCAKSGGYVEVGEKEVSEKRFYMGNAELWIPGKDDRIYATPTFIYHYIMDHHYQPPQEFLDAVAALDMDTNWHESPAIIDALERQYNPPAQSVSDADDPADPPTS